MRGLEEKKNAEPELYKVLELSEKINSRGLDLLIKYAEELYKKQNEKGK